jgi:hypothetical protein
MVAGWLVRAVAPPSAWMVSSAAQVESGGPAGDSAVMTGCTRVGSGGGKDAGSGGGRSTWAASPSIGAGEPGETGGNGIRQA